MGWDEIRRARERLSREQGQVIKDWGGRLPVALIYPNSYYLGMSSLAVHALYGLINRQRDYLAERVFWEPGGTSLPLSLESQRPLADFAALAFTINYEVDYLNVARILRASGIPPLAEERDGTHPLIIAGGPSLTANPMPLSPLVDAICLGDAEPVLPGLLAALAVADKPRRLEQLSKIPGVYVPALPPATPFARQYLANLDEFPTSSVVLTPDTELGELFLIEVGRGCGWGCRFCLVNGICGPVRFRSPELILKQAAEGMQYRLRVGLVGPAVADHPQLEEIVNGLECLGVGLSVSSLRIKPFSRSLLHMLGRSEARSIALAPEAGSARLRKLVGKGINEADVLEVVGEAAAAGIRQIKLYFIVGLPTETDEDIEEIIALARRCRDAAGAERRGVRLTLNAAPFVPKAGTPFQRQPMAALLVLNKRLKHLQRALAPDGIKVKAEGPGWSEVQAVLSRGGPELAAALAAVSKTSLPEWRRAVAECGLDADYYAHQEWPSDMELPWQAVIGNSTLDANVSGL